MRLHKLGALASLALGSAAIMASGGCSFEQPKVKCQSASGDFAVLYTAPAQLPSGACASLVVPGELIGLQTYNVAGAEGKLPNYAAPGSLALQDGNTGAAYQAHQDYQVPDTTPGDVPYALGTFAAGEPDDAGYCAVPTTKASFQKLAQVPETVDDPNTADVDEGDPGTPAYEGGYGWSNLKLYVTPAAPGTAFSADVTISRVVDDGGKPTTCNVTMHAVGLYPAIDCSSPVYKLDAMGNPELDMDGNPIVDKYVGDASLCAAEADPDHGRPLGSGINPDYKTKCVAFVPDAQFVCVLDGEPPTAP